LDLRLPHPVTVSVPIDLGPLHEEPFPEVRLDPNPSPDSDFSTVQLPRNVSKRLASYFPRARKRSGEGLALDLGCGDTVNRAMLEHAGYAYVGLDIADERAPMLADAHAIPFSDETFDLVLSVAAADCFRHPYVALRQVHRVLRPGGVLIGSIPFLTPYTDMSRVHHTHLGLVDLLREAGFRVEIVLTDRHWTALEAVGRLGLFPRLPIRGVRLLMAPFRLLHSLWWRIGAWVTGRPHSVTERVLRIAGDLEFVAVKPA
jgi:SAM-dependent methyltransferase